MALDPHFSWAMAEELATAHMRGIGFKDAKRAKDGADGGIDVASSRAVAQVKYWATPVGLSEMQRMRGIVHDGRQALFYAFSGYSAPAVEFANQASIALFSYTTTNTVQAMNSHARELEARATVSGDGEQLVPVPAAAPNFFITPYHEYLLTLKMVDDLDFGFVGYSNQSNHPWRLRRPLEHAVTVLQEWREDRRGWLERADSRGRYRMVRTDLAWDALSDEYWTMYLRAKPAFDAAGFYGSDRVVQRSEYKFNVNADQWEWNRWKHPLPRYYYGRSQ